VLPAKDALVSSYSKYLAANKVDKRYLGGARRQARAGQGQRAGAHRDLGQRRRYVAVRQPVVKGADGKPAVIAFDKYESGDRRVAGDSRGPAARCRR
jgi:hypothetical protein